MVLELEALFFCDLVLPVFDLRVKELFYAAAVEADEVVVVVALVQLKNGLAGFKVRAQQDTSLLKLGKHAVDGGQTNIDMLRQHHPIDVFGAQVPGL